MKYTYHLSHLAKLDLEGIWRYPLNRWSINKANEYYELILKEIKEICLYPGLGKSIHPIKKYHRIRKIKSHLIVYKFTGNAIFVDRILHERMDLKSRLTE